MESIEQRTIAKVSRRLVPFLMLCYFVAYLDRVNVGFAALTMNKALGISATAYGFGAGIFFFSYFIFEVPSNLALERFGARKWIARIMLSWGILSGSMALVTGEYSFYLVRVLLGAAEAGFFPGIIFYLTLWFPGTYRARIIGWFMAAIPLSSVLGFPVSGIILNLDGVYGLAGWQWLFIIEAAPALILSGVVFFYLTDRPADAKWLQPDERAWLAQRLSAEAQNKEEIHGLSVRQALTNPKVLALALVYFGAVATNYGIAFWLPQIVKGFGLTNVQTGFVSAIPYIVGTVGMVIWSRRSDEKLERKLHAAIPFLISAIGIAGSTLVDSPALEDAAAVPRRVRRVRGAAGVLDLPDGVPVGRGGGGGDRGDQRRRQSGRVLRAVHHGLAEGRHRQFRLRPVGDRGLRADGHGDRADTAARRLAGSGPATGASGGVIWSARARRAMPRGVCQQEDAYAGQRFVSHHRHRDRGPRRPRRHRGRQPERQPEHAEGTRRRRRGRE